MNTVILMGRFVDDPETSSYKNSDGDKGLRVTFTLAVQREGKDAGADFIRCVGFGKRADFIAQYFEKGQKALVTGRWQTGSYENKDGEKVYTNDCMISQIEFADSPKQREGFEEPERSSKNRR